MLRYEIWTYHSLPTRVIPSNYSITFIDWYGNKNYMLDSATFHGKGEFEQAMDKRFYMARSGLVPKELGAGIEDIKKRTGRVWLYIILVLAVLAVGILLMFIGIWSKKEPQRAKPEYIAPLVEVYQLEKKDIQMVVHGYGTVSPKVMVEIVPQIAGKIVSVNPESLLI